MSVECRKRVDWKEGAMVLTTAVMLLVAGCGFLEPRAPKRPFALEDLLIDQEAVPPDWELTESISPAGDTLCTTECASIGFRVSGGESSVEYGRHEVFRYLSTGIARRTFEKVYLSPARLDASASGWVYQSPVAEQTHFGCHNMAGNVGVFCEWGGQYEEFLVVFGARVPPGEVALTDMEQMEAVVRAIDERMAQYLDKPIEDTED